MPKLLERTLGQSFASIFDFRHISQSTYSCKCNVLLSCNLPPTHGRIKFMNFPHISFP